VQVVRRDGGKVSDGSAPSLSGKEGGTEKWGGENKLADTELAEKRLSIKVKNSCDRGRSLFGPLQRTSGFPQRRSQGERHLERRGNEEQKAGKSLGSGLDRKTSCGRDRLVFRRTNLRSLDEIVPGRGVFNSLKKEGGLIEFNRT